MRTALRLIATAILELANATPTEDVIKFFTVLFGIFIVMDLVEFLNKVLKNYD